MATDLTGSATHTANGTLVINLAPAAKAKGGLTFQAGLGAGVNSAVVTLMARLGAGAAKTAIASITLPVPAGQLNAGASTDMVDIDAQLPLTFDSVVTGFTGAGNVFVDLEGLGL